MHVKVRHPDKFEEFKKNFDELKKTAVVKESGAKDLPPGQEPPKIDEPKYNTSPGSKDPEKSRGDDNPSPGKSFLREFDEWLSSSEF